MNLSDELQRLQELHRSGALTNDEYAAAKATVLSGQTTNVAPTQTGDATAWVKKAFGAISGLVVFLLLAGGAYYVVYGRVSDFKVDTQTRMRAIWDEGSVIVTYEGKTKLTDTHFTMTIYTEHNSYPVDKYWTAWEPGEAKTFDVGYDRVAGRQKIVLSGRGWKNSLPVWLAGSFTPKKDK